MSFAEIERVAPVRYCYVDKARRYVRSQGNGHLAAGGSILDVPYVYERYGVVPESVYSGLNYGETKHDHGELDKAISAYMGARREEGCDTVRRASCRPLQGRMTCRTDGV